MAGISLWRLTYTSSISWTWVLNRFLSLGPVLLNSLVDPKTLGAMMDPAPSCNLASIGPRTGRYRHQLCFWNQQPVTGNRSLSNGGQKYGDLWDSKVNSQRSRWDLWISNPKYIVYYVYIYIYIYMYTHTWYTMIFHEISIFRLVFHPSLENALSFSKPAEVCTQCQLPSLRRRTARQGAKGDAQVESGWCPPVMFGHICVYLYLYIYVYI